MKSYRISLGAFQDAEIAASQAGFVPPATHIHIQADVEKLANIGIIADQAILANDKTSAIADVNQALTIIQEIESNDVIAIGNTTTKAAIETAVAGLQNLVEQVSIQLGAQ